MHPFLAFVISFALGFGAFAFTGTFLNDVFGLHGAPVIVPAVVVGIFVLLVVFRWLRSRPSTKIISNVLRSAKEAKDQVVTGMYDQDAEYYGKAEEEFINESFDKGVWAQALVKSDGNEEKRKVEYIKLRVKQLKRESKKG